jgi:hypothetical protein
VAEERPRQSQQEQVVTRETIEHGETRKGVFLQAEVGLPPGFTPPSAAMSPQVVEPVNTTSATAPHNQAPPQER